MPARHQRKHLVAGLAGGGRLTGQGGIGEPVQAVSAHGKEAELHPRPPVDEVAHQQAGRVHVGRGGEDAAQVQPASTPQSRVPGEEARPQAAADPVGHHHRVRMRDRLALADDGHAGLVLVQPVDWRGGADHARRKRRAQRLEQLLAVHHRHRRHGLGLLVAAGQQRPPPPVPEKAGADRGPVTANAVGQAQ